MKLLACWLGIGVAFAACGGNSEDGFDFPDVTDTNFGNGGATVVRMDVPPASFLTSFHVTTMAAQGDGHLVIAGDRDVAEPRPWVVRVDANGTVDSSCGSEGWASWSTGGVAAVRRILALPGGGYLVAGRLPYASVWKLRADCSIDESYGSSGVASLAIEATAIVDVDLDAQGRAVVVTESGWVGRFSTDGFPDPDFGQAGQTRIWPADGASASGFAIRVLASGSLAVGVGLTYALDVGSRIGVAKLSNSGAMQGEPQAVQSGANRVNGSRSLVLTEDGSRAIAVGMTQGGGVAGGLGQTDGLWASFDSNGVPDPNFGIGGAIGWDAVPNSTSSNYFSQVVQRRDGTLLACGYWLNNTSTSRGLREQVLVQARLADGTLIASYGSGGTGSLRTPAGSFCNALAVDSSGHAIALMHDGRSPAFALVRAK